MLANRGGHWPDPDASVNLGVAAQHKSETLTGVEQAPYSCRQSDCFDRTTVIPNDTDLADRLDSALNRIEAALAARTAATAAAEMRLETLKSAAGDAVAALDALIGDD